MRVQIACAALAAALAGCQTASYLGNENSPYYVPPAGSRLTLNQDVSIPPDQLAVYIQNGRVLRNVEVQHYYPFCKFELHDNSAAARTVKPDEITITKTVQQQVHGATAQAGPIMMARMSLGRMVDDQRDGQPMRSFSTRMDLHSDKQPDIFRLTCAQWGDPGLTNYVSIAEMRRTLGNVFTLRLPHE